MTKLKTIKMSKSHFSYIGVNTLYIHVHILILSNRKTRAFNCCWIF